jgi:nicotinamidase-related amidase
MDPRHPDLADAARSALVVVDVQEKLMGAIHDAPRVEREIVRLVEGAKLLGVPTLACEQYPAGLGPTTAAVAAALGEARPIEKLVFSAADESKFMEALRRLDRDLVVVVGIEAHVCVLQTALDLLSRGFRVHVAADATGSRSPENRTIALARMAAAGVRVTCVESVLFEWLRRAGSDVFRGVSKLVR